jgi:hypothetical protein
VEACSSGSRKVLGRRRAGLGEAAGGLEKGLEYGSGAETLVWLVQVAVYQRKVDEVVELTSRGFAMPCAVGYLRALFLCYSTLTLHCTQIFKMT